MKSFMGNIQLFIGAICAGLIVAIGATRMTSAQTSPSPIAPLHEGWENIDERFVFLTVELSSTEASLNAVKTALVAAGRDQASAKQRAQNYAAGNTRMDRQGGGPMDWQDFYGKTASSFYYHSNGSIDAQGQSNFKLHAQWQGKDSTSVARPPQFDYIYRANEDARKHAETDAAALGNQIDQLLSRRRELESEQSALWCKIALRGLSSRDLSIRPLYRCDLPDSPRDKQSAERFAAISAECKFMRTMNLLTKQAQSALDEDQAPVYVQLQQAVDSARDDLASSFLNLPTLADALADPQSQIGQFSAAAKRLDDLSQNLVDAYRLAGDGDRANDDQRKDNFRGEFQQTIMDFAATVLTADQVLTAQAAEWNITPDNSRFLTVDPHAKPLIVPTPVQASPTSFDIKPSPQPTVTPPPSGTSVTNVISPSDNQHQPDASAKLPTVPQNYVPDSKAIDAERKQLAALATQPLDGRRFESDQDLSQIDKPYEIKDVFRPADNTIRLKIRVGPGVEIRGGTIDLEGGGTGSGHNAQLMLTGTNSKPIILRHVEIDQPLGSAFNATHVIFDHCTFQKNGGWFAYYSSKWAMDQCLLYKCNFGSFSAVDYGFKLTNCTFVGMDFPEIEHRNDEEKSFDYMSRLRKTWNVIKSCNFVNCTILPTVFWCSEDSNFWACTFLPGAAFKSDTPTTVVAFVGGTIGDGPDQISQGNPPERAPLTIIFKLAPFPVLRWAADCPIPEVRHDDRLAGIVLNRTDTR
jgi:hypothetical protein